MCEEEEEEKEEEGGGSSHGHPALPRLLGHNPCSPHNVTQLNIAVATLKNLLFIRHFHNQSYESSRDQKDEDGIINYL